MLPRGYLLAQLVEHSGTDGSCVRAKNVLASLLALPFTLVTVCVYGEGGERQERWEEKAYDKECD